MRVLAALGRWVRIRHRWTRMTYLEGYTHGYLDGHGDGCRQEPPCPE